MPGTCRSRGRITQSAVVRRSICCCSRPHDDLVRLPLDHDLHPALPLFVFAWGSIPSEPLHGHRLPGRRGVAVPGAPDAQTRLPSVLQKLGQEARSSHGKQVAALRAFAPVQADDHDLAHDGTKRQHLRANPLRQDARQRGQALLHDLPGCSYIGVVVELDLDDVQPDARLTANGLDAGGPQHPGLDGLGNKSFDLFGRQAGAFGQDHHTGAVQIGKHVDRHGRGQVAAVDHRRQCEDDHQGSIAKRPANDCIKHVAPPLICGPSWSGSTRRRACGSPRAGRRCPISTRG